MSDPELKQKAELLTNFILERLDTKLNQIEKKSENQFKTLDLLKHECEKMQENLPSHQNVILNKEPKQKTSISESLHNYIKAKYSNKPSNDVFPKKKSGYLEDKENVPLSRSSEKRVILHHKENFYPTKESILKKTLETPEKDSHFHHYGILTPQGKENIGKEKKLNSSSTKKGSNKKLSISSHSPAIDSKLSHSEKRPSLVTILGSNSMNLQKDSENIQ